MADSYGLGKPLYDPSDANVDIVFVHGLGGHRINTWTFQPTSEIPTSTFWPKDLLPQTCKTARILSFGYDSNFAHFYPHGPKRVPVGTTIDDHSSALFQSLTGLRDSTKTSDRPIIFVAHSIGGLVCANALSRQHGVNESSKQLVDNTCGAAFLGTPFEGSAKARWGSMALKYLSLLSSTKKEDVKDLEERSQKLSSINEAFLKFLKERDRDRTKRPVEVACFFEEHPTFVAGKNIGLIVTKSSAGSLPGIDPTSISANHSGMCKFAGDYVNGYINISKLLARWITALDALQKCNENSYSVYMGETIYKGNINRNRGIVMGNAYAPVKDGIKIIGTMTTKYYGDTRYKAERGKYNADEDNDDN